MSEAISAGELIARVKKAVPLLAAEAAESERLRRPTDAAIAALEQTGLFRMLVPRCHGGLELDLDTFLETGLALAEADVSLAWVANFYVEHNWIFSQFPQPFQGELFAERDYVLAPATVAPTGRARSEQGGHRLSGRWQWGTGVMHASWVIVSAAAEGEADVADLRFFALPISDALVEDTWYVDGMLGTGSNDIVVEDAFVPGDRSVAILDLSGGAGPGAALHAGPLYHTPMIPILALAASMPVVGAARGAVRDFRELLKRKQRLGSSVKQSGKPAAQMRLARADLEARQAETLLRNVVGEVLEQRNRAPVEDRVRWIASFASAVHQCRRVIADISEASGASAHFRQHPLQRTLRDVNVAACHVVFDLDAQLESYGRVLLGLDPSGPLV